MRRLALLALALGALPLGACTKDDTISRELGAACGSHADCASRCLPNPDWPNGFCTSYCDGDSDCPPDAICVETEEGGVCLFACNDARDCDFLDGEGAAWTCVDFPAGDAGVERACGGE